MRMLDVDCMTLFYEPACLLPAEVLEIMRQSIESRKTALVELALDLIQRLIAHRALAGRVYSINHRRDLGGGGKSKRRGGDEEDEEGGPEEGGHLPPQVHCLPTQRTPA